jgi:protein-L-isoaspartate(D-aspartate) O-methyltransferase
MHEHNEEKMRFMLALRSAGVTDENVLRVMEEVPRELFIGDTLQDRAYENIPLPIDCAQTISQPSVVAIMTQAVEVHNRCKVLEVGAGSGYQTAILAALARRVYSLERHKPMVMPARRRLEKMRITNVLLEHGDGSLGLPAQAPFDRIMVAAAAPDPPQTLLDQLKVGGIMILPVGEGDGVQQLIKVVRDEDGFTYTEMSDVRFVPLLGGAA